MRFDHLPVRIAASLRAYYTRRRLFLFLRAVLATAVVYGGLALLVMHLDRFLFLGTGLRKQAFWTVNLTSAVFGLVCLVIFGFRRFTIRQIAYEFETRLPEDAEERFVTVDDIFSQQTSEGDSVKKELIDELEASAIRCGLGVNGAYLVTDKVLRRLSGVFALLALFAGLLSVPASYEFPLMVERFFHPDRNLPKPSFLKVAVSPESIRVGKGGEAVIQAEISGKVPSLLAWVLKKLGSPPNRCVIAALDGSDGPFDFDRATTSEMSRLLRTTFLFSRGGLQQSFRYQIRCGDAETEVRLAEVITQPKILEARLTVTPPEYTGLPEQVIEDFRHPVRLLPETEIVLSFRCDQPVPVRAIRFGKAKEPIEPDWDESTRTGTHEFTLKKKVTLEIKVKNDLGFANVDRTKISIGLLEDAAPTVRLELPASDIEKVPGELVPIQAAIEDDLGVSELALRFVLNPMTDPEAAPQEVVIPLEKEGERKIALSTMFDLDKAKAVPGDVVALRIRARDRAGNDGESREIFITIVSFTRGENERRRIAVLRFLSEALLEVQNSSAAAKGGGSLAAMDLEKARHEKIAEMAKKEDLELSKTPSVNGLLDILEMEHHLTDAPRHKTDVRLLYAALLHACAPFPGAGSDEVYGRRSEAIARLRESVLPGLIGFRQLKNVCWRMFGMRYEAANIRSALEKLGQGKTASKEQTDSVKRRAELFLESLQDVGDEVITMSREHEALDEERLKDLVGQMNTSANFMKRGSLKRRMGYAQEVADAIPDMLREVRSGFLPLFARETAARAGLQKAYAEALSRIAKGSPPDSGHSQRAPNVSAWVEADGRLMGRNPFLPFWPRFTNFACATIQTTPQPASAKLAALARLLEPSGEAQEAVKSEADAFGRLAFVWEARSVAGLDSISNTEKLLELTLLGMEARANRGEQGTADLARVESALKSMDLVGEAEASAVARKLREVVGRTPSRAGLQSAMARVGETARSLWPLGATGPALEAILGQFRRSEELAAQVTEMLKSTDSEKINEGVSGLHRQFQANAQALRNLLRRLYLQLCLASSADTQGRQEEILLLKMREAARRFLLRTQPIFETLKATAGTSLGARELTGLSADIQRLGFLQKTMLSRVDKLRTGYREGSLLSEEDRKKYVILKEFEKTRRFLELSGELLQGKAPKAIAEQFILDFPEAGITYLAAEAHLVTSAGKALSQCRDLLNASPPAIRESGARLSEGVSRLRTFRAAVEKSGAGDAQERIGAATDRALQGLERLAFAGKQPSAVEVQRKLFDLEERLKELRRLARDLSGIEEEEGPAASAGFRGGPEGIWLKSYRYQAEKSRQRLLRQNDLARRAVVLGILEGLKAAPQKSKFEDSYDWSLFLYRLVRSELAGVGGVRPPASKSEKGGDPHLRFLMEELEKARQIRNLRNYAEPTKEYLDSVADFLRY